MDILDRTVTEKTASSPSAMHQSVYVVVSDMGVESALFRGTVHKYVIGINSYVVSDGHGSVVEGDEKG
jgi:hypothetical protein